MLAIISAALLSACTAGPHTLVVNEIINFGNAELPPEMRNRNLIAIVAFDEVYAGDYKRFSHNVLYTQGVQEGTPEYRLRVVPLNLAFLKGLLYYPDGSYRWSTAALVPDHIERLKAWDVVEFRQPTGRLANKDFLQKGEGNVVLRVLCRRADPNYEKCRDALPQVGKYGPQGDTHTPYPALARDYGFSFTPAYDENGKPLRQIPEYEASR